MSDRLADNVADALAAAVLQGLAECGWVRRDGDTMSVREMRELMTAASLKIPELAGIGAANPTGESTVVFNEGDGKYYDAVLVQEITMPLKTWSVQDDTPDNNLVLLAPTAGAALREFCRQWPFTVELVSDEDVIT